MVNVQVPPLTCVTPIVRPEMLVLTIPLQPDTVYVPGTGSVTVRVCVELVLPLNVKLDGVTANGGRVGTGVGVGAGVGLPLGAGDGLPLGPGLGLVLGLGLGVGRGSSV